MSLLDTLGTAQAVKSSGPVQFSAAAAAMYDETTGRTYQLIERTSDKVPHCASRAGNHAGRMLDQLNESRRLTWQRAQLLDQLKPDATPKLDKDAAAAARAQIEQLSAAIKAIAAAQVDRCDRSARMLYLYSERGE